MTKVLILYYSTYGHIESHHGMIIVGLPYTCPELSDLSELRGGSPYGAGTVAAADGSRQPTAKEHAMARFQGAHVATQ